MRILHTMLRVGDLDRSIAFYTEILGMQLLRRSDYPEGRFTLAFVGYGEEIDHTVIELTHNWDTASYELGNGFGHLAVGSNGKTNDKQHDDQHTHMCGRYPYLMAEKRILKHAMYHKIDIIGTG